MWRDTFSKHFPLSLSSSRHTYTYTSHPKHQNMSTRSLIRDSVFGQLVCLVSGNRCSCSTDDTTSSADNDTGAPPHHAQPSLQCETLEDWWKREGKFQTRLSASTLCGSDTISSSDLKLVSSLNNSTFLGGLSNPHNWPTWKKVLVASQIW